jgi:hypothetical protein
MAGVVSVIAQRNVTDVVERYNDNSRGDGGFCVRNRKTDVALVSAIGSTIERSSFFSTISPKRR